MKRRGFIGALLGLPALPAAAKVMKELEKFDADPVLTATEITKRECARTYACFTALPSVSIGEYKPYIDWEERH